MQAEASEPAPQPETGSKSSEPEADSLDPLDLLFDDPEAIEAIAQTPETAKAIIHRLLVLNREYFSGPLPHPRTLEGYSRISPDFPERIVKSFEAEGEHRRETEWYRLRADVRLAYLGLGAGIVFFLGALAVAAYAISHGYSVTGLLVALASLLTAVSSFVYGARQITNMKQGSYPPDRR